MTVTSKLSAACIAIILGWTASAQAVPTYVGSWQVDSGPYFAEMPPALSGQQAAALLFGGSASDYLISTVSNLVADIDYMAWISQYGGTDDHQVAQDYVSTLEGTYAYLGDTSAYVRDSAIGSEFTNYAFRIEADPTDVPEPASVALLGAGLLALATVRRRRN